MTAEEKAVLDILKADLFSSEIVLPKKLDWNKVVNELKAHTVAAIGLDWISQNRPEVMKPQWTIDSMKLYGLTMQVLHGQQELVELMQKNSIDIAIMKGSAAAVCYTQPTLRKMGDVDFLVREKDYEKACRIMRDNGYVYVKGNGEDFHIEYTKDGVAFEIHRRPSGVAKGKLGKSIMDIIVNGLDHTEQIQYDEFSFPVLPKLQNGLTLILHISHHLRAGLGLRQIIDWMMFVSKNLDDNTWYSEFQPVFKKLELEKLAVTVTKMCRIYLGLVSENITWCDDVSEDLCNELISFIMEQGNFGRKKADRTTITVLSVNKNIFWTFKNLHNRGMYNSETIRNHKLLHPFAWIYQVCRYIKYGFNRKNPIKSLRSDLDENKRRKKLISKLGIKEKR